MIVCSVLISVYVLFFFGVVLNIILYEGIHSCLFKTSGLVMVAQISLG